jgi:hypothetical protein
VPGHWEGDLLSGPNNMVERHTRYVMLAKVTGKDTRTVVTALIKQAKKLPNELYMGPSMKVHLIAALAFFVIGRDKFRKRGRGIRFYFSRWQQQCRHRDREYFGASWQGLGANCHGAIYDFQQGYIACRLFNDTPLDDINNIQALYGRQRVGICFQLLAAPSAEAPQEVADACSVNFSEMIRELLATHDTTIGKLPTWIAPLGQPRPPLTASVDGTATLAWTASSLVTAFGLSGIVGPDTLATHQRLLEAGVSQGKVGTAAVDAARRSTPPRNETQRR